MFCRYHTDTDSEKLCRGLEVLQRRIGRCNADIRIRRVLVVRPGSSRRCQRNTCFLRFVDNLLCGSLGSVKTDEVSAERLGPGCNPQSSELLLENSLDRFELRAENRRVLLHVLLNRVSVAEEAHMAQLIDLVVADRLMLQLILDIDEVVLRGCERADSAAGESDLGGRCKFVDHIRMTRKLALIENLDDVCLF